MAALCGPAATSAARPLAVPLAPCAQRMRSRVFFVLDCFWTSATPFPGCRQAAVRHGLCGPRDRCAGPHGHPQPGANSERMYVFTRSGMRNAAPHEPVDGRCTAALRMIWRHPAAATRGVRRLAGTRGSTARAHSPTDAAVVVPLVPPVLCLQIFYHVAPDPTLTCILEGVKEMEVGDLLLRGTHCACGQPVQPTLAAQPTTAPTSALRAASACSLCCPGVASAAAAEGRQPQIMPLAGNPPLTHILGRPSTPMSSSPWAAARPWTPQRSCERLPASFLAGSRSGQPVWTAVKPQPGLPERQLACLSACSHGAQIMPSGTVDEVGASAGGLGGTRAGTPAQHAWRQT